MSLITVEICYGSMWRYFRLGSDSQLDECLFIYLTCIWYKLYSLHVNIVLCLYITDMLQQVYDLCIVLCGWNRMYSYFMYIHFLQFIWILWCHTFSLCVKHICAHCADRGRSVYSFTTQLPSWHSDPDSDYAWLVSLISPYSMTQSPLNLSLPGNRID